MACQVLVGGGYLVHQRVGIARLHHVVEVIALTSPVRKGSRKATANVAQQSIDNAGLVKVNIACIAHFNSVGDLVTYLGNFGIGFLSNLKARAHQVYRGIILIGDVIRQTRNVVVESYGIYQWVRITRLNVAGEVMALRSSYRQSRIEPCHSQQGIGDAVEDEVHISGVLHLDGIGNGLPNRSRGGVSGLGDLDVGVHQVHLI